MKAFFANIMAVAIMICAGVVSANAQIGYQVSILNPKTGEPRSNEEVSVTLTITNSADQTIVTETKSAMTNEFGIVSLEVGNASTFANMDWSKLPLWISATVDNVVIGKSQILNVPVAEYAKTTGVLNVDLLCSKTWKRTSEDGFTKYSFHQDGTGILTHGENGYSSQHSFSYYILPANMVILSYKEGYDEAEILVLNPYTNSFMIAGYGFFIK